MALISVRALILLLIAIIFVRFLPKLGADLGLALLSVYVLFISNNIPNFIISVAILLLVYFAGILISRNYRPKLVTCVVVVALAAGLILWKYPNFIISNINFITRHLLHREYLPLVYVTAPFGISYGFLILIAYIMNIYWGVSKPSANIFEYTHTVEFFPLWSMGPILGSDDLKESPRLTVTYDSLCNGALRIVWGMFKKLMISERCAVIVTTIYSHIDMYTGFFIPVGTLVFVLQLYTDFSGAMDIVCGAAEIIGKKLPENFDRPFASTNISEFWRRWHITLGAWLRTFIYYPLLKSRPFQNTRKKLKGVIGKQRSQNVVTYAALFITWFLIGLWHGGGWNYIFGVGIYYWMVIVAGRMLQPTLDKLCSALRINKECWSYQTFAKLRTLGIFMFGCLFFRAGSVVYAVDMLKAMLSSFNPWIFMDGSLLALGLSPLEINILIVSVVVLFIISKIKEKGHVREWLGRQNLVFRWIIIYALIFSIMIFGCYGEEYIAASFIYQMF